MKKAVFVDRDGTLNEMVYDETHGLMDSPRRVHQLRVINGAGAFLRGLKDAGFFVSIVTNQPGVAKGTMTLAELDAVNKDLARQLANEGAAWDELRFCPHHPKPGPLGNPAFIKDCACRKPKPGMLLESAKANGIALCASWMVGDGLNDVQAGRAAGCRTILVTSLKIEQIQRFLNIEAGEPDFIVKDLAQALEIIRRGAAADG